MDNEKTKGEKNSIIKKLFPIIFGIFAILEYLYFPNHQKNMKATPVYLYFLIFLLGLYLVFFIISFKNEKISDRLGYKSPLYAFVFAILIIYDLLTLKFAVLPLPYFAWLDMIMNSMIADKGFLLESTLASLKLLFTGYFIGAILGIITGILAGYSKKVDYWVDPFLKLLGPIPTTTWIPVVMVLATSLFGGAVFIIGLGVWFQTTLATMTGIKNVDKSYYEAAKTLGANENELVRKIAIPSASPNIFQGLISGMSSACTSLLVAEMLGVESGLGWYITWKSSWADYSSMYGAIIILALTFIIVNMILKKISSKALKWQKEV
ncbi:ABC transporter permease [Anaerococcus hydrogenalis]|uniref:ABC transporter permease n=1 Tax=Anaerococcus hydrogenalis TaxID=33029 RepID=A0A2N6UJR8_9FIRM|nr:ABC transporter permease subunit [Anaerococcus hydrogenalis]MDK7695026.1 ABC transporter permease subunit [Anaerococcus hydrogenalis]MDK7696999.1 ABC transporter permease subunit [Anaerococcus hydrogenalis]MDK7708053.1 ABC transporter permease subunit [Anaerococcus hydrogenalis]PMC81988.1 ABC transporter permease [Anaerococcus hydrogenalis]